MSNASAKTSGVKRGGICDGGFRYVHSVLNCEHIGKVTIKQIYKKGFRVVLMKDYNDPFSYGTIVIEEQNNNDEE